MSFKRLRYDWTTIEPGEDTAVVHTAYLKDDKTNKRMEADVDYPIFHVYCDDPTEHTSSDKSGKSFPINLDQEITHPFVTLEFDALLKSYTDLTIKSSTVDAWASDVLLRFRSYSTTRGIMFATSRYDGVTGGEYEIITSGKGVVTQDSVEYHSSGLAGSDWHHYKFVFNRSNNEGYWYGDNVLFGRFYGITDVAANMKAIGLLREVTNYPSFKNLKVTGYSKLEAAMGD